MEKLIFIIAIVVLSLLHSWWKKRQEAQEQNRQPEPWPGQPPGRRPPGPASARPAPPPSKAASWEEELRRLLEGEEPARPVPPPIVVPQPVPPPLPRTAAPRPVPAPRPVFVEQADPDVGKSAPVRLPSLEQSAQAFLRASPQVTTHRESETRKRISPAIRQAVDLVRNRQSQRAAIIAGIILGPPKAMES
jgi:hypothetical protein